MPSRPHSSSSVTAYPQDTFLSSDGAQISFWNCGEIFAFDLKEKRSDASAGPRRDEHECWTGVRQQKDVIVRRATLPGCRAKEMTTRWLWCEGPPYVGWARLNDT